MSKKVSRRVLFRSSVTAGAAAVVAPGALLPQEAAAHASTAAQGAALARRRLASMPPEVGYGGVSVGGPPLAESQAAQPKTYPGGWREGTTIPAEYYLDEKHYVNDEKFIAEHFWLMADHESRIPKPGDYFVFEYGRGDSVIVVRDQAGAVKAYHNVCRHRGSRVCQHAQDD